MATSNLSQPIWRPFPTACATSRPPSAAVSLRRHSRSNNHFKWAIQLGLAEQSPPKSTFDMQQLVGFLYEDLTHLFDDQGIDKTAYDERVFFRDPITKHDTLDGYLFNIALLKTLFRPQFHLHSVKPTGPYEITTRWTMVMKFVLLPWKPELVFTGTSVMGINPENGKFCSHVDFWDSIEKNDYFSLEGLLDVIKQLRIYKTPELESPKYQILRRTANYEVRQYDPFIVVETNGDKLSGSTGFNDVAGYIFGKNSTMEKIPMTTPVFTQANDADLSKVSIQIVLPLDKETESLPNPNKETVRLRKVEGGIAAVMKFSGKPAEDIVQEKEKTLRSNIIKDGLKPQPGCLLARYNDPGRTSTFVMFLHCDKSRRRWRMTTITSITSSGSWCTCSQATLDWSMTEVLWRLTALGHFPHNSSGTSSLRTVPCLMCGGALHCVIASESRCSPATKASSRGRAELQPRAF